MADRLVLVQDRSFECVQSLCTRSISLIDHVVIVAKRTDARKSRF